MKKDFSKKSDSDLQKDLHKEREGNRHFRFGISGSKVKNVKEAKNRKKEIARILTELNKRA